ncbi:hypothetical protein V1654_20370 [Serratia marcescens]|uniref:hypothetical protein n=1 Tax=Serratia marcescens TaxID=615 RepID=UPI001A1AC736|nr:hypothetical protein [Serratia marcescens]HAT3677763.1 hypothetical protein [Serratia marcescens]HAT3679178.1 hypothetical protein [Serratia marcescens]
MKVVILCGNLVKNDISFIRLTHLLRSMAAQVPLTIPHVSPFSGQKKIKSRRPYRQMRGKLNTPIIKAYYPRIESGRMLGYYFCRARNSAHRNCRRRGAEGIVTL